MPAYKDKKTDTWYVSKRYVNWQGKSERLFKRNFPTKKAALKYEREFFEKLSGSLDMTFDNFIDVYYEDRKPRIKISTFITKHNIIEKNIRPYFKDLKMCDISPQDVIKWQNELLNKRMPNGKKYDHTTLKTIHAQLSAIFNHAVRYYKLSSNPANIVGTMGKKVKKEMKIWSKEEYLQFSKSMMKKDTIYHCFEMLYWCGIRLGEMLALTPEDFNFEKDTVRINKSYQRINGEDVITDPKTEKSNRIILMPHFLTEEMQDYISRIYDCKPTQRIFPVTKSFMHHEMDRGCKESGVKRIRIHDLRHSHVSLLIELGFSAVAIADRVGHESIEITYKYAHLFPTKGKEIANKLDVERLEGFDVSKEL